MAAVFFPFFAVTFFEAFFGAVFFFAAISFLLRGLVEVDGVMYMRLAQYVATSDGGSGAAFNDSRAITDEGEVGRGHDTKGDEGGGNSSSWDAVTIRDSGLPLLPRAFFSAE